MRGSREGTKTEQIACLLQQRFPERQVSSGGFIAIASELGASKALVTRVAQEHGFRPATPRRKSRRPEGCKHCGNPVEPGKRVCPDCMFVTVACDTCGRLFKRRRDQILERVRDPRYNDGVFCSRRCVHQRRYAVDWRPSAV